MMTVLFLLQILILVFFGGGALPIWLSFLESHSVVYFVIFDCVLAIVFGKLFGGPRSIISFSIRLSFVLSMDLGTRLVQDNF